MTRAEDFISSSSSTNFTLDLADVVNATAKVPDLRSCKRYTGNHLDPVGFNKAPPYRHLSVPGQTIVTASYAFGIIGTLTALFILHKDKKTKYKNKKHLLMLGCLLGSDLVALLGSLAQMYIQLYVPIEVSDSHTLCVFRVIWRWFGLASGCVAAVMAVERYFAITHPFFYQMHITYQCVLKAILISWTFALAVVCMPFIGFGLYFDESTHCCKRHRFATEPDDVAYAYLWFVFGFLLCICISWANLTVTKALCRPNPTPKEESLKFRRICKSSSFKRQSTKMRVEHINASTPEEVAFARLMVALSVTFLICWVPQLMTIPLAQYAPGDRKLMKLSKIADILMAIHFTLDPYIYVLLRYGLPYLIRLFQILQRHFYYCAGSTIAKSEDEHTESCIIDTSCQSQL